MGITLRCALFETKSPSPDKKPAVALVVCQEDFSRPEVHLFLNREAAEQGLAEVRAREVWLPDVEACERKLRRMLQTALPSTSDDETIIHRGQGALNFLGTRGISRRNLPQLFAQAHRIAI